MPIMKRLFLLRHAKSSWDEPGLADHDRPLAGREFLVGEPSEGVADRALLLGETEIHHRRPQTFNP